jgi:hypothetical protein
METKVPTATKRASVENQPCANTDRELWREKEGDYYAPSIHVTATGGIGINVGGHVWVKTLREWHALADRLAEAERDRDTLMDVYRSAESSAERNGNERNRAESEVARLTALLETRGHGPNCRCKQGGHDAECVRLHNEGFECDPHSPYTDPRCKP